MTKKCFLLISIMWLLATPDIYGNGFREKNSPYDSEKQIASFKVKKNAVAYVKKLKKEGTKAIIKKGIVDGQVVYRVLLKNGKKGRKPVLTAGSAKPERKSVKEKSPNRPPEKISSVEKRREPAETPARSYKPEKAPEAEKVPEKPVSPSKTEVKTAPALPERKEIASSEAAPPKAAIAGEKASEEAPAPPRKNGFRDTGKEVEIAKFENKEDAQKLLKKISDRGYVPILRSDVSTEGKTVYRVFVLIHDEQSEEALSSLASQTGEAPASERPARSPESANVIEEKGRNLHGGVSISEEYTDNAFYTKNNRKSGYVTLVSPEVWFVIPHYYLVPLAIEDSTNRSPGGLLVTRLKPEVFSSHYAYLDYRADIPMLWHNFPAENTVTHNAKGRFIYRFGQGVYLDLIDQFVRDYETRATNISVNPLEVDKFKSNLFNTTVYYDTGNRFRLRLDYSNFLLLYDDPAIAYRERTDNAFSGYVFYKIKPKTSLFVQYTFTDISYKSNKALDSHEQMLEGGLQWDITAKSTGIIKAGYEMKDFKDFEETFRGYTFELQAKHQFDPKNYLSLIAFRRTHETDVQIAGFIVTHGVRADYRHVFSPKLNGLVGLQYEKDKYHDLISGIVAEEIEDETYQASATFQYNLQRWLRVDFGYAYLKRNSNIPSFEFTNNTLLFRITGFL